MRTILLIPVIALFITPIKAQKTKDHWITFNYNKLPLEPLDKQVASYQSTILSWEEGKAVEQEALYEQELAAYRENYSIAQDRYKKEMDEYNKKTRLEKIVDKELLEEGKPVFNPPPYPEFTEIPTSPDHEALASKYLSLDGYKKGFDTPVFITVTLKEIDLPEAEVNTKTTGEGENQKTTTTYISRYKQPIKLTVESSVNGILYDDVIPESMKYYSRSTSNLPDRAEMKRFALNDLLGFTNTFINDRWGKSKITWTTSVALIEKYKKYRYPEFEEALPHAISGYNNLYLDPNKSVSSFNKAINIWEKVLEQYDPNNKKARINREVAWYTMLNLGEAYLWINNFEKADEYFSRMEAVIPEWDKKRLQESKARLQDHRERFIANSR